ncbi:MAG: hypothetical protein ATN31_07030 [Candidatus Epulonipiscioides saccharophilum]|nr:MAG: hypothetical protein ATN31_07030 [Epulopiscium sp. AS2M-Bin001]
MKIAVLLPEGFEEIEAMTIIDILRRGKQDVTVIALGDITVKSAQNVRVIADLTLEAVNFQDYGMLVMPGGPGADNYLGHDKVKEAAKEFLNNPDKLIGAICAAPNILGQWNLMNGRKVTVYPTMEVRGAEIVKRKAIMDGNLITGAGPGAAADFALLLLLKITDAEVVRELRDRMIFQ